VLDAAFWARRLEDAKLQWAQATAEGNRSGSFLEKEIARSRVQLANARHQVCRLELELARRREVLQALRDSEDEPQAPGGE